MVRVIANSLYGKCLLFGVLVHVSKLFCLLKLFAQNCHSTIRRLLFFLQAVTICYAKNQWSFSINLFCATFRTSATAISGSENPKIQFENHFLNLKNGNTSEVSIKVSQRVTFCIKTSQRIRFCFRKFTTRQTLNSLFYDALKFEVKTLQRISFRLIFSRRVILWKKNFTRPQILKKTFETCQRSKKFSVQKVIFWFDMFSFFCFFFKKSLILIFKWQNLLNFDFFSKIRLCLSILLDLYSLYNYTWKNSGVLVKISLGWVASLCWCKSLVYVGLWSMGLWIHRSVIVSFRHLV